MVVDDDDHDDLQIARCEIDVLIVDMGNGDMGIMYSNYVSELSIGIMYFLQKVYVACRMSM